MAHGSGHHVVPLNTYLKVLGVLLVLTVITVATATPVTGVHFGALNAIVAMAIASTKAGLVLAIFMGLKYDDKLFLVLMLTSVFFLILLFSISIVDIYTRVFVNTTL
jgi:cytochrome c oxidase subunit IV